MAAPLKRGTSTVGVLLVERDPSAPEFSDEDEEVQSEDFDDAPTDAERTAREELSKTWSQIPIDSRQLCTDLSTDSSPSYVELLTCLEMQAVVDARIRHTDASH